MSTATVSGIPVNFTATFAASANPTHAGRKVRAVWQGQLKGRERCVLESDYDAPVGHRVVRRCVHRGIRHGVSRRDPCFLAWPSWAMRRSASTSTKASGRSCRWGVAVLRTRTARRSTRNTDDRTKASKRIRRGPSQLCGPGVVAYKAQPPAGSRCHTDADRRGNRSTRSLRIRS